MTELEMLERAQMYTEKLVNGINSITNLPAPKGEIVHHVRLSRCFAYMAEVLRQNVEQGGVLPRRRPEKACHSTSLRRKDGITSFSQNHSPSPWWASG